MESMLCNAPWICGRHGSVQILWTHPMWNSSDSMGTYRILKWKLYSGCLPVGIWSQNHLKILQKSIQRITRGSIIKFRPNYNKLSDCGSHFGASCLVDSCGGTFLGRPVFRTSDGVPSRTDVSNISILRKRMTPATPTNKQARIQQSYPETIRTS